MKNKVVSQPQAEDVDSISEAVHKPIVEALNSMAAEWHEDQIDGPIKWRDTVNELDAYIEEFTREREALINRLALEGFALIPAMTAVIGVADVDMGDWRNWKVGDIVEVILENDSDLPIGKICTVAKVEDPEYAYGMPIAVEDDDVGGHFWPEDKDEEDRLVFKFVRRP